MLALTPAAVEAFRSRLEDVFKGDVGGDRRVKVETSPHRVADPVTGEPVDQVQFTVYVERSPESVPTFGHALEIGSCSRVSDVELSLSRIRMTARKV